MIHEWYYGLQRGSTKGLQINSSPSCCPPVKAARGVSIGVWDVGGVCEDLSLSIAFVKCSAGFDNVVTAPTICPSAHLQDVSGHHPLACHFEWSVMLWSREKLWKGGGEAKPQSVSAELTKPYTNSRTLEQGLCQLNIAVLKRAVLRGEGLTEPLIMNPPPCIQQTPDLDLQLQQHLPPSKAINNEVHHQVVLPDKLPS